MEERTRIITSNGHLWHYFFFLPFLSLSSDGLSNIGLLGSIRGTVEFPCRLLLVQFLSLFDIPHSAFSFGGMYILWGFFSVHMAALRLEMVGRTKCGG
jgi:hypothetical protein